MKKRCLSLGLTTLSLLSLLMLTWATVQTRGNVSAASPFSKTFVGSIPSAVTSGQAHFIGHHVGTDQLALTVGLPLRNEQALKNLLSEVSSPGNPHYRQYLTLAQENQAFNPTLQQEQHVADWLESHGLRVTHTYPNHLLVDVTGTFAQIEQLFHVTINDYNMQLAGKQITFYAPANEPTVDSSVNQAIDTIVGLDDYPSFQVDASPPSTLRLASSGNADGSPPYYPQDFANAYDVNPLWNAGDTGVGQRIGIVLWGPPPSSAALQKFDAQTGATPPNLQIVLVKGGSKYPVSSDGAKEAAMDVETTSGMAPGATIGYYEAPDTPTGSATASGLEAALNMAGTDPSNNQQISDSWHRECEPTQEDAFIQATEQILLANSATGHNYFFSSGDSGSACGGTNPLAQYPATSAYVTSVGGTQFSKNIAGAYQQETAWRGSGGGYSLLFSEPAWQASSGVPDPKAMRGLPDVAADAAQTTGAFICYDSSSGPTCTTSSDPQSYGRGTSLAAPLWAGMIADVNQYVQPLNELPLGFIDPLLYQFSTGSPYSAYHDIKTGSNGSYPASPGWDAVTGLGSPDLYNFAQDAAYLDGPQAVGDLSGIAVVSANDAWAVGYSENYDGGMRTLTEHWNGSSWNVVPSPNPDFGYALFGVAAVSSNDVWAVGNYYDSQSNGYTLIEHWNGSYWSVTPSPNPGLTLGNYLFSVAAASSSDVWAVGYYYDSSNAQHTLIEHWNGSVWKVVPSPNPSSYGSLASVVAVSANDAWAIGEYNTGYGVNTLFEQWNGTSWKVIQSPNPSSYNYLSSGAVVSANDVWAVGSSWNPNNNTYSTLIENWNGTSWSVVSGISPGSNSGLRAVVAVSANDIWAVGTSGDPNGYGQTMVEQWNGSTWNIIPNPNPGDLSTVLSEAAAVSANDIWAVGNYAVSNGGGGTLIEQWNGTSWNVVPSPQ